MPSITINIPEEDVVDAKAAAASYASLPVTATPKELIAGVLNTMIVSYRINHTAVRQPKVE